MYESFFGFRERPFDLTPNPRYLVLTDAHREALSTVEYGISSHKGVTLLIGEAGTGKTTVIRTALSRQGARVHCVHLHNPALTRVEFVEMLAVQFGLSPRARASKTTLLLELEELLRRRHEVGESTVLIVDEAQSLPLDLLEEIRLLANFETDEVKLLSVIIAGQPELAARLNDDALRQLKQRVALRCHLRTLTLMEAAAYIAGRIRAAGGVGAQVFTREAVTLIHEHSGGIPRTMSVIADNALLSGFAMGQRPVNAATVREVCRDFDLRARPGAAQPTIVHPPVAAPPATDEARLLSFEAPQEQTSATTPPAVSEPDLPLNATPPTAQDDVTATGPRATMFSASQPKRWRFSFLGNERQG
jgi:general secretion pathway protein A